MVTGASGGGALREAAAWAEGGGEGQQQQLLLLLLLPLVEGGGLQEEELGPVGAGAAFQGDPVDGAAGAARRRERSSRPGGEVCIHIQCADPVLEECYARGAPGSHGAAFRPEGSVSERRAGGGS